MWLEKIVPVNFIRNLAMFKSDGRIYESLRAIAIFLLLCLKTFVFQYYWYSYLKKVTIYLHAKKIHHVFFFLE